MRSVGMDPRSRLIAAFLPGLVAIVFFNPALGEAVELHDSPHAEAIVPASDPPVVISPTQGDQWPLRSRQFIRWSGFISPVVSIEISYNGGADWTDIANTSNTGSYEWIVTERTRLERCDPTCTIRITDLISVISGSFTISDGALIPARGNTGAHIDDQPIANTEKLPLILIYGIRLSTIFGYQIGGDEATWDGFLEYFVSQPALLQHFKPYVFFYDSLWSNSTTPIFDAGAQLRDALHQKYQDPGPDSFAGKPVVIVAHSMGGLVARSFMQHHWFPDGPQGGERVLRLITLATPHHGTPVANDPLHLFDPDQWGDFVQDLQWDNHKYNPFTADFPLNDWLRELNCIPDSICPTSAGYRTFYEKIFAYAGDSGGSSRPELIPPEEELRVYGYPDNDGVVPVESALFEGRSIEHYGVFSGCDHFEMANGDCGTAGQDLLASIAAAVVYGDDPAGPDLTGVWLSLTQRCEGTGETQKCRLKGKVRTRNQGNQKTRKKSYLNFYLSPDNVLDGGDTFLRKVTVGTLKPGKTKSKELKDKLPTGENASGKYVIAVVDATDRIAELDETNNVLVFGPIPFPPNSP